MRLSRDIVTALYQFTSKCGQIRKLLWVYGSSCFLHCIGLATFRKDFFYIFSFFLSEVLWREHIRDKRIMWHSGILKKLDTLLFVGQIQNPPEPEQMQVFCLQPEEKKRFRLHLCASFTPFFHIASIQICVHKSQPEVRSLVWEPLWRSMCG